MHHGRWSLIRAYFANQPERRSRGGPWATSNPRNREMSRAPIFLRVDATPRTGYERLARGMILAAALQRRRRPVYFLAQLEPNGLAMSVKRGGNNWVAMNNDVGTAQDLRETTQHIRHHQPAAIFVDDADATENYLKELMGAGVTVLSIDHLATSRFPSQVIVNPLLGPSKESYEFAA